MTVNSDFFIYHRCNKHTLPFIHDDEFDIFLESHVPADQLIIIYITHDRYIILLIATVTIYCIYVTSSGQKPTPVEAMLNTIHIKQHRNRTSPCTQVH